MNLFEVVKSVENYVIDLRRHFHQYPEVSMKEFQTMEKVKTELEEMKIPYEVVPDGGIIGTIEGIRPGKTVMLRADLDALPVQESPLNVKQPKKVVSKIDGVAHACGHDAHMAMLLGAAKILQDNRDKLNGKVLLVFERGEEIGGGIYALLKRLTEIGVDGLWGIHMKNDLPSGKISVDAGPRMAAAFPFHIKIKGKGGHGSRPDLATSPVDCFVHFYQTLTSMRLNALNPHDPITFSVGMISAGDAANVIPDEIEFSGTGRYLNVEQGRAAVMELKRILEATCKLHRCTFEYVTEPIARDILVYNQEDCAEIAERAIESALGRDVLSSHPAWMASEPFAYYQKYFPGVFAFLGTKNEALGTGAEHHNSHFDIDEDVLKIGVAATVQYAIDFLAYEGEIHFEAGTKSVETLFQDF